MVRVPPTGPGEPLLGFVEGPAEGWELRGTEFVDGRPAHVVERTDGDGVLETTQTLWIDAATFLPRKHAARLALDDVAVGGNETVYADFGSPVDVRPPAAALLPTPTPEPLPETSGGSVEIVSRDIYFEPNEVSIPANEDVVVVLPNEGVTGHNFSIDELGVSVDVAWGTTERIVLNTPPGVYEFYCDVPGHKQAGQVGTLTVGD